MIQRDGAIASPTKECATCGKRIDVTRWYSVKATRSENGETAILPFCSERCRNELQE